MALLTCAWGPGKVPPPLPLRGQGKGDFPWRGSSLAHDIVARGPLDGAFQKAERTEMGTQQPVLGQRTALSTNENRRAR